MFKVKSQLEDLVRIQSDNEARQGCLRLDLNENVTGLPEQFVKDVLSDVDAAFLATYPQYKGLIKTIAEINNLAVENISLGNGSDGLIKYIFEAFISQGDRVLLTDSTFQMYNVYCRMYDVEEVIIKHNADFFFPEDRFIDQLGNNIRMAVVVNPSNPMGTALNPQMIQRIVQKASEHNVLLLIDEAYFYYYPYTAIDLVKKYPNIIILRTFSKLCGMAALRIGFAAADESIIRYIEKVKPSYDVGGVAVLFARKLLDRPEVIAQLIENFKKARNYFHSRLKEEGILYRETMANFTLINVGRQALDITQELKKNKILVKGGFRQDFLADYIRVTIGDVHMMESFLNIFLKILKRT